MNAVADDDFNAASNASEPDSGKRMMDWDTIHCPEVHDI
jgi:hypothetical protein